MDGGGSSGGAVRGVWLWLYSWLRILLLWFGKLAANSTIHFRRWLSRGRENKSMAELGRLIYQLNQENHGDVLGDSRVQQSFQSLAGDERKRNELEARLKEREKHYTERVARLKERRSSRSKEGASEPLSESDQAAGQEKEPQAH